MREVVGVTIVLVGGQIHHPLQKIIRLLVVWITRGLHLTAFPDHRTKQLFLDMPQLLLQLPGTRQKRPDNGMQETGQRTQQADGQENVLGEVNGGCQPLF
jgi:hypothetical protein